VLVPSSRRSIRDTLWSPYTALVGSARWQAAAGAYRASPPLALALIALTALTALAAMSTAVASGVLVSSLPQTITQGIASPDGARVIIALPILGALFVLQQLIGPLRQQVVGEALGRRYMGLMHRRIMRAALRPATVRHLEEPALHDKVQQSLGQGNLGARVTGIGGAPPALASWAAERLRGAVALLVVAHFNPALAFLLAAVWLHHQRRLRAVHNELLTVRLVRTPGMRYAQYLGWLPLGALVAKEFRVFGLGTWLAEKVERTWLAEMATLWEKRRGLPHKMALATLPVLAVEALTLVLIVRAAVAQEIGIGALLVYVNAVLQSQAFGAVSDSDLTLQYGTSGLVPLAELERAVAHDPTLALPGTRPAAGLPHESIRFEAVSFTYPGRIEPVLRGLNLHIEAGRSLAVVGANGAGKTTLVKLLARLHDPDHGRIIVDGQDLREIDPRQWQRRVAAIFQDFVKYQLPAYDNVALGAPEYQADRALVIEAARRAGALPLIESLPHGWDTILSREYTGGTDLSGGQWQRIGLARALFAASAGASILVLDEPTAHLDVRAEASFYDSFLDLTKGLTTILISHRFSTVRRAERIVVLEGGQVVEDGAHAALIRLGGRYAHMFGLQAQRFADEVETRP
jgi:ATP-binding cassette, subfamily B, bacterial